MGFVCAVIGTLLLFPSTVNFSVSSKQEKDQRDTWAFPCTIMWTISSVVSNFYGNCSISSLRCWKKSPNISFEKFQKVIEYWKFSMLILFLSLITLFILIILRWIFFIINNYSGWRNYCFQKSLWNFLHFSKTNFQTEFFKKIHILFS